MAVLVAGCANWRIVKLKGGALGEVVDMVLPSHARYLLEMHVTFSSQLKVQEFVGKEAALSTSYLSSGRYVASMNAVWSLM